VNEMTNNLSNYLKGINYEKVGKYEEAFNIFQNDFSDFSLSKLVIYQYLGLGTDKNYKSSLENLKKIKSNVERKFLASYLLLNEDKKNSIDYLTSLEGLANNGNINSIEKLSDLYLKEETDFFSDKEAINILEKYSSKNISTIFFKIAEIYSNSNYGVYDRKLAIDNYKKANDLGLKLAKERVKKIEGC